MPRRTSRLSKLILWEIILLFLIVLVLTYMPVFIEIGSVTEVLSKFLRPVLMILFFLIVIKLFLSFLEPVFKRALRRYLASSYDVKHTWQFLSYLIWIIAFIVLSFLLVGDIFTMGIFLGALILVVVIISHRVIANFMGWLYIIFSSSIRRGDLIEVDGIRGKIAEVSTFNMVLEETGETMKDTSFTGRKVSIPNYYIFRKPFFSVSSRKPLVWDEITVLLPAKTDHLVAEDIMVQVGKSIAGPIMKKRRKAMARVTSMDVPSVPTTDVSLESEGVRITLRYFCTVSERDEVRSAISENILKEFKKEGIELTFKSTS